MRGKRLIYIGGGVLALGVAGFLLFWSLQTRVEISEPGPAEADGLCPTFEPAYPSCEIQFGNSGLSVLNSFYETFVGEGAFEIDGFTVETRGPQSFLIVAGSNRGPLTSDIIADRMVRLGSEQENTRLTYTQEASYCHAGRIYQNQIGYLGNRVNAQVIEYWREGEDFWFQLAQGGNLTARVVCQPE